MTEETAALLVGSARPRGNLARLGVRAGVFVLVLACAIGGFLFGYDTGVISGALLYLRDDPILEGLGSKQDFVEGAIVSGTTFGAAVGAGLGSLASDRLGRRKTILVADVIFVVGPATLSFASSCAQLIWGRVIVGLGVGLASMIVRCGQLL